MYRYHWVWRGWRYNNGKGSLGPVPQAMMPLGLAGHWIKPYQPSELSIWFANFAVGKAIRALLTLIMSNERESVNHRMIKAIESLKKRSLSIFQSRPHSPSSIEVDPSDNHDRMTTNAGPK